MLNAMESLLRPPAGRSVSVCAENVYGKKGQGGMAYPDASQPVQDDVIAIGQNPSFWCPSPSRELGQKWKVRPCIWLPVNSTATVLDADGPGMIRHFWMTFDKKYVRDLIIRMYWDGEETPSVECPLGDFLCSAPKCYADMKSMPICVNPDNALNSYWLMPFRKHAKITIENRGIEQATFFYTINYTEEPIAEDAAYFHASFRRMNPVKLGEDFTIVDGIKGKGSFAGCFLSWQQNNDGWWGEGEVKMFIDGDTDYPSICGTGTEDYVCGAWGFCDRTYCTPYAGYIVGGAPKTGTRHAMYRFHIQDPIWFNSDFKATIQALGWRRNMRYLPLQDDISAVAYWYQQEPHAPLAPLPSPNEMEVI